MTLDTVFNEGMRPVFVDDPSVVRRRLMASHPEDWTKVCIGETGQIVTVTEYLYEEKYRDVLAMLNELLRKQGLAMYQRNPERLKIYVEASAKKIIERVMKD
jgi:hypothetical protein